MSAESMQALPADLFHLLAQQLSDNADFPTLYNCIVSSKQLANAGAISALYRISHDSPVKSGGNEGLPLAEQELNVQRWSILWRTIILSALGKTLYPYCRYLRMLDLRDLGYLLEDDKFRGSISKHFFADELSRFHFVSAPARGRWPVRLDRNKIITDIGNEIAQQSPLLETLSEPCPLDTLSTALLTWTPRLSNLRRLELFDGKAFADEMVRNLLHAHCRNLNALQIYRSSSTDTDHALASFISGMPENKLAHFELHGECGIGAETCLALNNHGKSLHVLKLCLSAEGMQALAFLQGCTSLRLLTISSERGYCVDLKATQNDVYLQVVEWLKNCKQLTDLSFINVSSAPDLIMPVLLNKEVRLEELEINATNEDAMYIVKDHHDFHKALGKQSTLRRLHLRADPDPVTRDDLETLMNAFCSLKELRELKLIRISDYFSDEHIALLGQHLPLLESLYLGGYGISNGVLPGFAKLKNLKAGTFSGITTFSSDGLMNYIDQLGPENEGLVLSVENADPDSALTQEEQDALNELIQVKVNGRFEYQLLRDPDAPQFEGSDSSD